MVVVPVPPNRHYREGGTGRAGQYDVGLPGKIPRRVKLQHIPELRGELRIELYAIDFMPARPERFRPSFKATE
jgi:hypothetical protein